MRAPIWLLCAALAGCAGATTSVQVGGGTARVAAPGTTTTSATFGLYIGSGSTASALLGAGLVGGAIYNAQNEEDNTDEARHAPPMDPNRTVLRQDCTQPIKDPSANLMCE